MLATLISLATEAGGHGETSKTPFYIAGAILAGWAVIVSALGIMRHEAFPAKGARTGIMAITVLLVVAVMATSITTA